MDTLESINSLTRQAYNLAAQKYHDLFHNEMNEKEYDRKLREIKIKIYSALFTQEEIVDYFKEAGFTLEFFDKRNPYDFEINNKRIFAVEQRRDYKALWEVVNVYI